MRIQDIDKNFVLAANNDCTFKYRDAYILDIEGLPSAYKLKKYFRYMPGHEQNLNQDNLRLSKSSQAVPYVFSPTAEHPEKTHYQFYQKIRNQRPDIPIIMMSAPKAAEMLHGNIAEAPRGLNVIKKSYADVVAYGDKNVYFINVLEFYSDKSPDACTVELCHPTVLGFHMMAIGVNKPLHTIIE